MAIWLTEGDDVFWHTGDLMVEDIQALGGNDQLTIYGGVSYSAFVGLGEGNDGISFGNMESITAQGGNGNDGFEVYDNVRSGSLYGDAGDDYFRVGDVTGLGSLQISGGSGDDIFAISADNYAKLSIAGGAGYDEVSISGRWGVQSHYTFNMGGGVDELFFNGDRDNAEPEASITVSGNNGDNKIFVAGSYGQDNTALIRAGAGNDDITAYNFGNVTIRGGSGNDTLYGGGDNSTKFYGEDGNDYLAGNGKFWGGAGSDTFEVRFGVGQYTAMDFDGDSDKFFLRQFEGILEKGALSEEAFRAGTQALDADDRIIYDSVSGKLFLDSNGNAAGGKQWLSTFHLVNGTVDYTDFFVYEVDEPPPGEAGNTPHGDFFHFG